MFLYHILLFAFCVYLKCVFTQDPAGAFKGSKKIDHVIEIPIGKPSSELGQPENIVSDNITPQLALEGGGIVDLTSTVKPNDGLTDIGMTGGDTDHSKGSKPRKGVQLPSSSVPRKGVDPLGALNVSQSSVGVTSDPIKESTFAISDSQTSAIKIEMEPLKIKPDQQQPNENLTPKISHHKKPVVVTDIEDVDDFEKYPIIQTSTTGEDYIIIGIVIVLGIWCSIFGALIFYRRAGEYWDRRHYRRMDFLVEGMYND